MDKGFYELQNGRNDGKGGMTYGDHRLSGGRQTWQAILPVWQAVWQAWQIDSIVGRIVGRLTGCQNSSMAGSPAQGKSGLIVIARLTDNAGHGGIAGLPGNTGKPGMSDVARLFGRPSPRGDSRTCTGGQID